MGRERDDKNPSKFLRENRGGEVERMLEVRKEFNGIWVGNGEKRVFINEWLLDNVGAFMSVSDNPEIGEVVYTLKDPLIVGRKYTSKDVSGKAEDKTIVVSRSGFAYQRVKSEWVGGANYIKYLPEGVYEVVWVQE